MSTIKSKNSIKKNMTTVAVLLALGSLSGCQNVEQPNQGESDTSQTEISEIQSESDKKRGKTLDELMQQVSKDDAIKETVITRREQESERKLKKERRAVARISPNYTAGLQGTYKHPVMGPPPIYPIESKPQHQSRENYNSFEDSGIVLTEDNPVSTFSIDVDTASYSNVRRMLNQGYLPPKDAVRLEEFVNYFDYDFKPSSDIKVPFKISSETMTAPWNKNAQLLQIGIKGFEPNKDEIPPANLVFLVDVSGSMNSAKKLGLVKKSLQLLTEQMDERDRISMVVYAGSSGVVLEPTSGNDKDKILEAIEQLRSGGSTNGAAGIDLAYKMAKRGFIKEGINRVILATDGDFNVGITDHQQLINLIERKRKSGVFFSALGFGSGNYNDHLMEQLANKGNGNAAYIDSLQEAKKVLVDQGAGTLMTIAKDVKIQVEFNPNVVSEYRLLGYENRTLQREDFNNDKVDAGEVGAGHTVTALYEVVLKGSPGQRVDPLRYGQKSQQSKNDSLSEVAIVKLRYKLPKQNKSNLLDKVVTTKGLQSIQNASNNIKYAASVAGFAQLLRGSTHLEEWSWDQAIKSAQENKGADLNGYRSQMIQLMKMAQLLDNTSSMGAEVSQLDTQDTQKVR